MSQQQIDKETMIKIYKFGSYFNPAHNHYGYETNVVCDRCFKSHLSICIGWQTYDLCLSCVNEIDKEMKKKSTTPTSPVFKTNMEQNQFKTYMLQSQYRNCIDDDCKTFID